MLPSVVQQTQAGHLLCAHHCAREWGQDNTQRAQVYLHRPMGQEDDETESQRDNTS